MSVDADIDEDIDLFGLDVTDLQADVEVGEDGIEGTLKYVADYSTAWPAGEDSGNYLVIHAEVPEVEGVTITAELVNGLHGPKELDEDGLALFHVTDKSLQKVKIVASKAGCESVTKVFDLKGLTLNES